MKRVAIVLHEGARAPVILFSDTDATLLDKIRLQEGAPAINSLSDARKWLATLPAPSGIYDSETEALEALKTLYGDG